MTAITKSKQKKKKKKPFWELVKRDKILLGIIALPVIYYIVYKYLPMLGLMMAFQDIPRRGSFFKMFTYEWVGFDNFIRFFSSAYFWRLLRNTFLLSLYSIAWSFPVPIIFAIMLNEVRNRKYRRTVQTLTYMPYFISLVVAMGIVVNFLAPHNGLLNQFLGIFGVEPIDFMHDPKWFRTIYILSGIWQTFGYNAIIYIAAITAIDPQLYEAAKIDGASKVQQVFRITIPCIMPTVIIMLILNLGNLLNVGFEKVLLLYSPSIYEVSDVISTYVYRVGLQNADFGFGTAVGLFNSVINFTFIIVFNKIARSLSGISLW